MPNATMLMIVPEMIWSARTEIDSQAWTQRDEHAATISAARADEQGRRGAEEARDRPRIAGRRARPTTRRRSGGEHHALDPDVDDPGPLVHEAAEGPEGDRRRAAATIDRRDDRQHLDQVADELEEDPDDRDAVEAWSITSPPGSP